MTTFRQADPQPTLIFIPDITGFTEFVHSTEISHSQHIIEELLENIIDSNDIGLEISEIEGDAVLFFRMGKAPSPQELLEQVRNMYINFHTQIKRYESQRICQCGACGSAHELQIKFIAHYGIVSRNKVKTFSKLFGKELITAHRLLKNNIDHNEYVLLTHDLLDTSVDWNKLEEYSWAPPVSDEGEYDFGKVKFCYLPMEELQTSVPEPKVEDFFIQNANTELIKVGGIINAPIQLVFDVVSDVSYRHHWTPGIKDSTDLNGKITKTGSTHRCLINDNAKDPYFISHSFEIESDLVTWIESDPVHNANTTISLERIAPNQTRITQAIKMKYSFLYAILGILILPKFKKKMEAALHNLQEYCQQLHKDGKSHHSQVLMQPVVLAEVKLQ